MSVLAAMLLIVLGVTSLLCASAASSLFVELTAANVTSNIRDWDTDMAIMFYTPRNSACRQLSPVMEQIAEHLADRGKKNLVIGRFNCEEPSHSNLCDQLEVDRYPAISFVGFGSFNQAPRGNAFGVVKLRNVAYFPYDYLYGEIILDWINLCSSISWMHRVWDDVKSLLLFRKNRHARKAERLVEENKKISRKNEVFSKELEKYKADEIFDQVEDLGDVYPLLHNLEPEVANLPLRYCVGEMATEYCQYHKDEEPHCKIVPQCVEQSLEPAACRPAECPFENSRGCRVTSVCMQPSVIEQYKQALAPYMKGTSSSNSAGIGSSTKAQGTATGGLQSSSGKASASAGGYFGQRATTASSAKTQKTATGSVDANPSDDDLQKLYAQQMETESKAVPV